MLLTKELRDAAFEKTMMYIKTIYKNMDDKTISIISRSIGNYESELEKALEAHRKGEV